MVLLVDGELYGTVRGDLAMIVLVDGDRHGDGYVFYHYEQWYELLNCLFFECKV